MNSAGRQRPAWKPVTLIAGSFVALVLAVWGWIQVAIERRWAEMDRTIQSLFDEARALEAPRPLLRGDPLPEDAWDSYREALRHRDDPKAALEHLRRGARCGFGASPYDGAAPDASLHSWEIKEAWDDLARLAVTRAEWLQKEGRTGEAVDVLLDVCQLGRDLVQQASPAAVLRGEQVHRMALAGIRDLVVQKNLPKEALVRLGHSLRILDESFHSKGSNLLTAAGLLGRAIRNDQLERLRSGFSESPSPPLPVRTWRCAWSLRLEKANSVAFIARWMRRLAAGESESWPTSQEECERIRQEAEAVGRKGQYPILEFIGFQRLRPFFDARSLRAKLRLLRVATHFLATGETLELDDPFGKKLRHSFAGNSLRVWSLGMDGIDNGGEGGWEDGNDCVLQVSR
jgi:hypothetical protein